MVTCKDCEFFVECCGNRENAWGYCDAPLSIYHAPIVSDSPRTLNLNSNTEAKDCRMFFPIDLNLDNS